MSDKYFNIIVSTYFGSPRFKDKYGSNFSNRGMIKDAMDFTYQSQQNRINKLEKALDVAMSAIEFYGYKGNYNWYYDPSGIVKDDISDDLGETAIKAKQKIKDILEGE